MAEDWLEVYGNRGDCLSNSLRLNEISIPTFFQCYFKINRNQLEIVLKETYCLHSNKFFKILYLTFWGRSLVTKRFILHSNSRGADEIKGSPISIDFYNRKPELLLLFSIISPWHNRQSRKLYTLLLVRKQVCCISFEWSDANDCFGRNNYSMLLYCNNFYIFPTFRPCMFLVLVDYLINSKYTLSSEYTATPL